MKREAPVPESIIIPAEPCPSSSRALVPMLIEEASARSEHGVGYPGFIPEVYERYLRCGLLCHGFVRVHCDHCNFEHLVAFSCKTRGLCPSCNTRRMHDTAAHLVDRVLPHAPYRQWVYSFPKRICLLLARDPTLITAVLRAFLRVLFAWQRRRARKRGIRDGQCGAVIFIQRFGGFVNLIVHFHAILPDGVFTRREDGRVTLVGLGPARWFGARVACDCLPSQASHHGQMSRSGTGNSYRLAWRNWRTRAFPSANPLWKQGVRVFGRCEKRQQPHRSNKKFTTGTSRPVIGGTMFARIARAPLPVVTILMFAACAVESTDAEYESLDEVSKVDSDPSSIAAAPSFVPGSWYQLPGRANDIGVGGDGSVYIIGYGSGDREIYKWNPGSSSWTKLPGAAWRIDADAYGVPYVVTLAGDIYKYLNGGWSKLPGAAMDIACGTSPAGVELFVISRSTAYNTFIHKWNGSGWLNLGLHALNVSAGHNVLAFTGGGNGSTSPIGEPYYPDFQVPKYYNYATGEGGRISPYFDPGRGVDIGMGNATNIWITGPALTNNIFAYDNGWVTPYGGNNGGRIDIGPDGRPWLLTRDGYIYSIR